ncbi:MAG: glutamate racemase [Parcubacteria group bacterium Gr01-1014_29]|nr:MAG: glutamate racemase [Parcubacteria group bacterium Gr01-1014_29]
MAKQITGKWNIGVFDSGLGGLFLLRALTEKLPAYDYIYVGDTKRVPYSNRSPETVYEFTRAAVRYLFKNGCQLVVLACNTASALALRRLQQEFLPQQYPERRILGVLAPLVEAIEERHPRRIGVLATQATVNSHAITRELKKRVPGVTVFEHAAPLLVPMVESGELQWADAMLTAYIQPLLLQRVEGLALGCTHYPILKRRIRRIVGKDISVISQDEFLGKKLADYLMRHPEIEVLLGKRKKREFFVTDKTSTLEKRAQEWFGKNIKLKLIHL